MGWGARIVGLMVTAGAVGVAAHRKQKGKAEEAETPAEDRGYQLLDCRDVEIVDADRAMQWAFELGQRSSMGELLAELGGGCPLNQEIIKALSASGPDKLRFMYDLARSALQGHVQAGASAAFANLALAQIRGEASKLGVNVAGWPQGVA